MRLFFEGFIVSLYNDCLVSKKVLHLVGITARTNLQKELNPLTAVIGKTVQTYFEKAIANTLSRRIHPGVTFCVYTDYESDYRGDYTYFIGEEVEKDSLLSIPTGCQALTIPAQDYTQITTPEGPMPKVCIDGWYHLWQKEEQGLLGGNRAYIADFEVYDHRAKDPAHTILDIYVGIKKKDLSHL